MKLDYIFYFGSLLLSGVTEGRILIVTYHLSGEDFADASANRRLLISEESSLWALR